MFPLYVVQLELYYFLMQDVITFVQNLAFAIIMLKRLTSPCAHLRYICYLFCSSAFGVFNQKILMLVRVMAVPYHTSGNLTTCIYLPFVPLFLSGSTNTEWLERASTSRHSSTFSLLTTMQFLCLCEKTFIPHIWQFIFAYYPPILYLFSCLHPPNKHG
jgi:hypothetical protein